MIDAKTKESIYVSNDGDAGLYIMVPLTQLAQIESALKKEHISYWADEEVISINGEPEIAVINLGRNFKDSARVQRLVDGLA